MTDFIKKNELSNNWFHIDATNAVVGRLAAEISKILSKSVFKSSPKV